MFDSDCCRYLRAVPVLSEEQRADFNQLELVMTKEFISQQLIYLIGCLIQQVASPWAVAVNIMF